MEVLHRVLGIEVTQRDDGSKPRMPDALFALPDGSEGALEVTTIGDRTALERETIAAMTDWRVEGATWAWIVHAGPGVLMRDLRRHLPALVLGCERAGVGDPRALRHEKPDEAARWLALSDIRMYGFPETSRPGQIDVLPNGGGGTVCEHLDELPDWLSVRLHEPDLLGNIDKLRATGRSELHLFLRIHDTAMPYSLYDPLAFRDYVPLGALDAPSGLTGLWLVPAWRNPILWWSRSQGWARADCFDLE